MASLWLGFFALAVFLWIQSRHSNREIVYSSRNFYGVLTVFEHRKDEPTGHHVLLQHGRITHGFQFVHPQLQSLPTTYYGPESGLGLAFAALLHRDRRIGVVGLGTGTIAAYGRPGDLFDFYEINPQVSSLATSRFTYLAGCRGNWKITEGDARLALERQAPQHFDLIALDAFNSDSIPVHLLTREAFNTYLRHLKPDGILAIHTSNHFLKLDPVVTRPRPRVRSLFRSCRPRGKTGTVVDLFVYLGSALAQCEVLRNHSFGKTKSNHLGVTTAGLD
jgi:SAM-dependent methyltransferase